MNCCITNTPSRSLPDRNSLRLFATTGFIFKFHRRAFSWSNLERVDELVHIHRAPDLREILEAIIVQWSERFLHPIRNGMYDFRFRSDMAREVAYISRQSAEEMAAFNFTLDESQALKSAYETNIARLRNEKGQELQDMVAGLGELHEFDQEYETARLYYRRAISLLDAELEDVIGGSVLDSSTSRMEIIRGAPEGQENARLYMTWGIARLRLMLQVGMTFEHARNLERAEMEYQNARTLARSLLLAMVDEVGRGMAAAMGLPRAKGKAGDRLHALKHLNLLFQPMFAEAWVAEKVAGGVDTSTSLAEEELWRLRRILPFVRESKQLMSESPTNVKGSNFSLIATELHNKAGDLYFFKGRQLADVKDILDNTKQTNRDGVAGYLLRAHYHYAVGLHELRRFVTHRKGSSAGKLNFAGQKQETISSGGWPDFVFRAVGGGLNDMAEGLLGRISLLGLLRSKTTQVSSTNDVEQDLTKVVEACIHWMEGDETGEASAGGALPYLESFESWLGIWRSDRTSEDPVLLRFDKPPATDPENTFFASLGLSLVGARFLEMGGYLEDAGREVLKVCDTVCHVLWWGLAIKGISKWKLVKMDNPPSDLKCWDTLFKIGIHCLDQADHLFRRSRRSEEVKAPSEYMAGETIPISAVTQACWLGLAAVRYGKSRDIGKEVQERLKSWVGPEDEAKPANGENPTIEFSGELKKCLVRHSYPMINRLHTLRILIDDVVLGDGQSEPDKVKCWTEELLDLEAGLNAPLHFTPLHSGVTCALVYFWLKARGKTSKRIEHAAERALLVSQEMYTMRRSFYETISDLYYLYDDFNDRQLHFNQAIQMAGSELASLLLYCLEQEKRDGRART